MKAEDMTEDIYKSGSFYLGFETKLSFETDTKIYSRIKEFAKTLSDEFGVEVSTHYIPEVQIKYDEFN